MSIEQMRRDIIEVGKRYYHKGYAAANDGNISVRIGENRFLCTATGSCKGYLTAEDIILVDGDGNLLEGTKNPSSEIKMHVYVYNRRSDINAVVHAHPPYATGYATAGIPLDKCVLPEIIITMGSIPLAPYGTPSTMELPKSLDAHLQKADAFLLANHGVTTIGKDVFDAYFKMERTEHYAFISFIAHCLGGENVLSKEAVKKLVSLRSSYGFDETAPPVECKACDEDVNECAVTAPTESQAETQHPKPQPVTETSDSEVQRVLAMLKTT